MKLNKLGKIVALAQVILVLMVIGIGTAVAQEASAPVERATVGATAVAAATASASFENAAKFLAIGITMFGGSLAAAIAVGKIGAAAMGAAAEKPELLGKAIAFVGLGEGIALFGFLISLFLLNK